MNNLLGSKIASTLDIPSEFLTLGAWNGAQLILESENVDGNKARFYSPWVDLKGSPWNMVFEVTDANLSTGNTDIGFDPERIIRCGIKIALNSRASESYQGNFSVCSFSIDLPTVAVARSPNPTNTDQQAVNKLTALPEPAPGDKILSVDDYLKAENFVQPSIRKDPQSKFWELTLRYDKYQIPTAQRSARAIYELKAPSDFSNKTIVTWVAIGPTLRGAMSRPNLVQLELYDAENRVMRGPAADCSKAGMRFDKNGMPDASQWMQLEASPVSGGLSAPDYTEKGFDPHRVQKIGIRFEVGKFSDALRKKPYPLNGELRLSEFRIKSNPRSTPVKLPLVTNKPIDRKPVMKHEFMVGLNYAFINYGWDIGQCPYGQRDIGGFSTQRHKLERDFSDFKANGIKLVRVFLLGDLRTGVVLNADGYVTGLDKHVLPDLDALIDVAAKHGIKLMPVLVDFLIADGVSNRDIGEARWVMNEGEAVPLLIEQNKRASFLENGLKPIIKHLATANASHSNLIYAIDIANEIENARAIMTNARFLEAKTFVQQVRDLIRQTAPDLPVSLGSRNRENMIGLWSDLSLDIWQYHYYDRMEEEERRPLAFPAGSFGFANPIILGEVEPSEIERKLDVIYANGYHGALFWSYSEKDGFSVDLSAIKRWLSK